MSQIIKTATVMTKYPSTLGGPIAIGADVQTMKDALRSLTRNFDTRSKGRGLRLLACVALAALPLSGAAQTTTIQFTNIWNIAAGTRTYVSASAGNERGITINPVTTNVILASRASSPPLVPVLDGNTGVQITNLDVTLVSGGTFAINKILAAQDGVIYAANLRAANGAGFLKLYRWWGETNTGVAPDNIFNADLGDGAVNRWGDSMAIRGAGTNTQIMVSGSSNPKGVLFTTTDGTNFTPTVLTLPSSGAWQKGLSFGAGNSIYAKLSADATVKLYNFNPVAGTASLASTYSGYDSTMVALRVDLTRNILAGPLTANLAPAANHLFRVYDVSSPGSPSLLSSTNFPSPNAADANLAGEADIQGDKIVGISAQNGVVAFRIYYVTNALPPAFTSQPSGTTNLQGGFATFKATANGTQPLRYQWYRNSTANPIAGATTNVLVVSNLTAASNGNYFVVVTNAALTGNSITSSMAFLAVSNSVLSTWLTPLYAVPTSSRSYLADDNNTRGLAYNSPSNHLLVTSRTPAVGIYVLDGDSGSDLHAMDISAVSGGDGNALNLIGVADDGVVYACNLHVSSGNFRVYRWDNDDAATVATVIYDANPGVRLGDSMAVRGAGANTQIMFGEQAGGKVHLLTTTDGLNFSENILTTDATSEALRNGLAFGRGNTYWSKDFGGTMRYMSLDSGATLALYLNDYTFPTSIQPIAYDPVNDLLAGIAIQSGGASPGPDNIRLYDVANLAPYEPLWLDTEFFSSGNINSFGTGALGFGNGRLYALDSHNGIAVFAVNITNGAPAITVQPASLTNNVGANAIFGANSSGYPHSYQWLYEGTPIDSATNGSLVILNSQVANSTNYQIVISNASGVVTSAVAQLWFRPTISSQPQPPSQVVMTNDPVSYSVGADGTAALIYQWRLNGAAIGGATDASYSIASAQISDIGDYTVVITNSVGSVTSQIATLVVTPSSTPGTGTGLRGDYYTNNFSVHPFSGSPALTRTDTTIDFDWGTGSPDPLISTDKFTVRWTGMVQPLYSQTYTFYTVSDDGIRLWVNGQKLIDNWTSHASTTNSGSITLTANQQYSVVMDYFENTGFAVAKLMWSSPSQVKEAVPMLQLYPAADLLTTPTNVTVSVSGTNLVFGFGVGTYDLVWSTNVLGPYTNRISGVASPYTNRIGPEATKFFRLWTQ